MLFSAASNARRRSCSDPARQGRLRCPAAGHDLLLVRHIATVFHIAVISARRGRELRSMDTQLRIGGKLCSFQLPHGTAQFESAARSWLVLGNTGSPPRHSAGKGVRPHRTLETRLVQSVPRQRKRRGVARTREPGNDSLSRLPADPGAAPWRGFQLRGIGSEAGNCGKAPVDSPAVIDAGQSEQAHPAARAMWRYRCRHGSGSPSIAKRPCAQPPHRAP